MPGSYWSRHVRQFGHGGGRDGVGNQPVLRIETPDNEKKKDSQNYESLRSLLTKMLENTMKNQQKEREGAQGGPRGPNPFVKNERSDS